MGKLAIRSAVRASLHTGSFYFLSELGKRKGPVARAKSLGALLRYAAQYGMCGSKKVRKVLNLEELADNWIKAIVGMCLAHDKDTYDANDAQADKLLGPILTMPVKQVREFYPLLMRKMQENHQVPMLVIMGFDAWGEVVIKDAPDEGIIRLKNKLAGEIAALVEEPIRDQIPGAIKRALRWRDPQTLENVKEQIKSGVKPKLRGRESCLFLEGGRGKKAFSVML